MDDAVTPPRLPPPCPAHLREWLDAAVRRKRNQKTLDEIMDLFPFRPGGRDRWERERTAGRRRRTSK